MTQQEKASGTNRKKPRPLPEEEVLVITPAGPMRKGNVHQVGPNQAVRRNDDGTYSIVPKGESK